jgi:adenylate cyclase
MVAMAVVQLRHANERSAEATVRLAADSYLRTFEAMRGLYTSDVVNRLPNSVEITHDYLAHEHAVPLPATFTIALAERLGRSIEGLSIRLYSEYPFPFRGPTEMDDFERMALDSLKAFPSAVVSAVEGDHGSRVLRYALGDTMRLECVACHNAHPESPKHDWEVGDLRGVLAVSIPMTSFEQRAREARRPYTMLLLLALLGLLGAVVVLIQDFGKSPRGTSRDG